MSSPYTTPGFERASVFDERNSPQLMRSYSGDGVGSGYLPRNWQKDPLGLSGCAAPFYLDLIPEDEWFDRIKEQDEQGVTLSHVQEAHGIVSRNQGQTPLCWAYAGQQAMQYVLARSGVDVTGDNELSAASGAAYVTGFRLQGNWSTNFLIRAREFGLNSVREWPHNAMDRKLDTEANRKQAATRLVREWMDFPARGVPPKQRGQMLATALLNRYAVATGHNWMQHAVTMKRLIIVKDRICFLADNSGLYRDQKGETVFSWQQGLYDDAVAPTSVRTYRIHP